MTPSFRPTSVSVTVESGVELTISHNDIEALLKTRVVLDAARVPIVDLEQSTTFGPCTYQVTNATGFDAEYELSLSVAGQAVWRRRTRVRRRRRRSSSPRLETRARVSRIASSNTATRIGLPDRRPRRRRRVRRPTSPHRERRSEPQRHASRCASLKSTPTPKIRSRSSIQTESKVIPRAQNSTRVSTTVRTRALSPRSVLASTSQRSKLLLRSDVCVLNGTERPILMCFQRSVAATATVFGPIPPSESVWLPIPLSRSGVKCSGWQCSPNEDLDGAFTIDVDRSTDDAFDDGSPFLSPLRKSRSLRSPSRARESRARTTGARTSTFKRCSRATRRRDGRIVVFDRG